MKITIRPYRPADRDALVALWKTCDLLRPWNDPDDDLALVRDNPNAEVFLGEFKGRVVASCLVGHDGHRGWLYYLASEPVLRGRGFGAQLVRHCEAWLAAQGLPKVQLMIRSENLEVRRFYQRLGYEPNSCCLMQRWLSERGAPQVVAGARPDGRIETTITYLAMRARPALPQVAPPQHRKTALMRAANPTVGFYRFLYNSVGKDWLWWERRALSDDELAAVIGDERVEIYVLYVDGVPAGFAEIDRRERSDVEIAYFGLVPEFIGQGIGRYLLVNAIDIAWSHEPERLRINTNTLDHPKALPLYQRCGFVPYEQRSVVFDDPRLNGLISA